MPSDTAVSAFLVRARTACREGRVQVTRSALEDAEDLGWDFNGIVEQVLELEVADFEKSEPSKARASDTVWVFCPETRFLTLWIRLVERADLIVVSFHEK